MGIDGRRVKPAQAQPFRERSPIGGHYALNA